MRTPPAAVRKTLTHDQGREIARDEQLARRRSIHIPESVFPPAHTFLIGPSA
jgi:hypothetical protein